MSAKHACNAKTLPEQSRSLPCRQSSKPGPGSRTRTAHGVADVGARTKRLKHAGKHPSLHKATEANSRSTAAPIRQSLQNAKTAAEFQAVLAAAQEAYNQSEAEYDKAAAPANDATSNRDTAAQTYSNEKTAASQARNNADAALASEIEKAQAAADAGEKRAGKRPHDALDAKSNAAEKQKAYDEALNKAAAANDALCCSKGSRQ